MKVVVAAFNQEKALVEAFSVITNLRMDLFQALYLAVILLMDVWGRKPLFTLTLLFTGVSSIVSSYVTDEVDR